MKTSTAIPGAVIGMFLLGLTGCASKPTTADLMRQSATEMQEQTDLKLQLANNWEKGTRLISAGEKRVKDGERRVKSANRDLKNGQDDILRGTREIAEGQKLVQESERRFRESRSDFDIAGK